MQHCPFHLLTGLDCPMCGGQRMVWALLCGNASEAFRYNPMLFCLLIVLAGLGIVALVSKRARMRMGVLRSDKALVFYLVVLLLWGIGRNIYGI